MKREMNLHDMVVVGIVNDTVFDKKPVAQNSPEAFAFIGKSDYVLAVIYSPFLEGKIVV